MGKKNTWPLKWLITCDSVKILGLYYCKNLKDTIEKN